MLLLIVSFVTFNFYENFRSFIILTKRHRIAVAPAVFASSSGSAAISLIEVAVALLLFSSNSGSDSGATI